MTTGTHEILTLPDKNGKEQKLNLFLGTNWHAVPSYIWKVLYHADTKAGIGFLLYNNPYAPDCNNWTVCSDGCKKYEWYEQSFEEPEKGCTYCCKVSDISLLVPDIPLIEVTNVLTGMFVGQ